MLNILIIMGITHVIGDFLFQSESLANEKKKEQKSLLVHALLYALAMSLLLVCVRWKYALLPLVIIAFSHLIIDFIKIKIEQKLNNPKWLLITFCVDQCLHLTVIFICWIIFVSHAQTTIWFSSLCARSWFQTALLYFAMFAIIWDPTSVFIKKVFCLFPIEDQRIGSKEEEKTTSIRTGELIGKLERLIVAALVLNGAAASIGFVLTAKSVARFKQFDDKDFAERYLVGTLLSVSIALCVVLIGEKMIT